LGDMKGICPVINQATAMPSGSASENPVVVASEVDKRLGDLLARYLGAFSGQRQGWKTPKRTP